MTVEPVDVDDHGRMYFLCPELDDEGDSAMPHGSPGRSPGDHETRFPCKKDEANLVSSLCADGLHMPVIDVDMTPEQARALDRRGILDRARWVKSTNHWHAYLDDPMSWPDLVWLLLDLAEAEIVQVGFVQHAYERGSAFVRVPWVTKPAVRAAYKVAEVRAKSSDEEGPPF